MPIVTTKWSPSPSKNITKQLYVLYINGENIDTRELGTDVNYLEFWARPNDKIRIEIYVTDGLKVSKPAIHEVVVPDILDSPQNITVSFE